MSVRKPWFLRNLLFQNQSQSRRRRASRSWASERLEDRSLLSAIHSSPVADIDDLPEEGGLPAEGPFPLSETFKLHSQFECHFTDTGSFSSLGSDGGTGIGVFRSLDGTTLDNLRVHDVVSL